MESHTKAEKRRQKRSKCFCPTCGKYPWMFSDWDEHDYHKIVKHSQSVAEIYKRLRKAKLPGEPPACKTWNLARDLWDYGPFSTMGYCKQLLSKPLPVGMQRLIHRNIEPPQKNAGVITFRRYRRLSE